MKQSLWFCLFVFVVTAPQWARASSFIRFLDHTQRRTTVGRTHLDEWSARRRDLYLTTYNTHNRQTSMPQMGFKPTIPAGEPPQIYALDRHFLWFKLSKSLCSKRSTTIIVMKTCMQKYTFQQTWAYHILQSTRLLIWMHERNAKKLHVQVFLRTNTWMLETCQRQYN